jgi:hypothetical protein
VFKISDIIAASVLVLSCKSDKPKEDKPRLEQSVRQTDLAAGSGSSQFARDRKGACDAFAARVQPGMKDDNKNVFEAVTSQCMQDTRITKNNYPCLMAAKSAEDVDACFKASAGSASATFDSDRKGSCEAYAKHVVDVMMAELRDTAVKLCLSSRMTEETYDCVMKATTDPELKKCLGVSE